MNNSLFQPTVDRWQRIDDLRDQINAAAVTVDTKTLLGKQVVVYLEVHPSCAFVDVALLATRETWTLTLDRGTTGYARVRKAVKG